MGRLKRFLPFTGPGAAIWAWRNRRSLTAWGSFATRGLRRVAAGEKGDVLAEARLRAALTVNDKTRANSQLAVEVKDGEAILAGVASPEVHRIALATARRTKGVTGVRDHIVEQASKTSWFKRRA